MICFSFPLFGLSATAGIIFLLLKVAGTSGQGWTEKYARQPERKIFAGHSRRQPALADRTGRFTFAEKCNPPQVAQDEWLERKL